MISKMIQVLRSAFHSNVWGSFLVWQIVCCCDNVVTMMKGIVGLIIIITAYAIKHRAPNVP